MLCKLCRKMKITNLSEIANFDETNNVKIVKIKKQNFILVKRKENLSRNTDECGKLLLKIAKHMFPNPDKVITRQNHLNKLGKIFISAIETSNTLKLKIKKEYSNVTKFSTAESTYLSISVFKTIYNRRKFQKFAKGKFGKPLLCSENEQKKFENDIFTEVYGDNYDVNEIDMSQNSGEISENRTYFRVKEIKIFIENILTYAVKFENFDLESHLERLGYLHVVVSADHGGDLKVEQTMKYSIQIFREEF